MGSEMCIRDRLLLDLRELNDFKVFMEQLNSLEFKSMESKVLEVYALLKKEYEVAISEGNANLEREELFNKFYDLSSMALLQKEAISALQRNNNQNNFFRYGDYDEINEFLEDVLLEEHRVNGGDVPLPPPSSSTSHISEIVTIGGFTDNSFEPEVSSNRNPNASPDTDIQAIVLLGYLNENIMIGYYYPSL